MKQDTLTGAADKQPLVSVIMPAYNAEKYIGEAIASVCAQTYKNWNLLILDDGSADRTVEIACTTGCTHSGLVQSAEHGCCTHKKPRL